MPLCIGRINGQEKIERECGCECRHPGDVRLARLVRKFGTEHDNAVQRRTIAAVQIIVTCPAQNAVVALQPVEIVGRVVSDDDVIPTPAHSVLDHDAIGDGVKAIGLIKGCSTACCGCFDVRDKAASSFFNIQCCGPEIDDSVLGRRGKIERVCPARIPDRLVLGGGLINVSSY